MDKIPSTIPSQSQSGCGSLFVTLQSLHWDSGDRAIETTVLFYSINLIHSAKWTFHRNGAHKICKCFSPVYLVFSSDNTMDFGST